MIRYLDIRYLVISHDTGHDVTTHRYMPCDISHTPDHLETPSTNPNSTKTHHLVAVYSCFFRLCLCPHLGCVRQAFFTVLLLSISWTHHKTDRITSKQQPWAPGLGLLPERMHVCFCFIFLFFSLLFFLSLSFFLLDTWYTPYSSCEVPDILLLLLT